MSRDPWQNTKTVARSFTLAAGALALLGIAVQEGENIAENGLSQWLDASISGLDFLLVLLLPAVVIALVVAMLEDSLRRRAAEERDRHRT